METIKKRIESNLDEFLLEILPIYRKHQSRTKRRRDSNLKRGSKGGEEESKNFSKSNQMDTANSPTSASTVQTVSNFLLSSEQLNASNNANNKTNNSNKSNSNSSNSNNDSNSKNTSSSSSSNLMNDLLSPRTQNTTIQLAIQETKRGVKRKITNSRITSAKRGTTFEDRIMKVECGSKDEQPLDTLISHTRRVEGKVILNTANSNGSQLTDAESILSQMHPMQRYHLLQPELMTANFPAAASAAAIAAATLPNAFPFDLYRCLGSLYPSSNDRN